MKKIFNIFYLLLPFAVFGQEYTDYVGAGHSNGITVTTSHSMAGAPAENVLNGKGMDSRYFEAARFLSHATMGHTEEMVQDLLEDNLDFEAWIDDQFLLEETYVLPKMEAIWDTIFTFKTNAGLDPDDIFGPYSVHFNYAYWQVNMTNDDVLRHKVANALSQILVVSENSDLGGWGESLADYYDMLLDGSFGNYRDLLEEISLSIQMGYYLSHFNNAKENPAANTSPDENYAREIMQLFTIGLYELNLDGTRVLDSNGDPIPTYDQDDIQEYAKIFTGLGVSELINPDNWPYEPFFGLALWASPKTGPMAMYEDFHEPSQKVLLGGEIVPANQPGLVDIDQAIDNLFNHANVAPFISSRLIQRLVKSNPTPEYVERVATVFNDNGSGVKGDMKAVIKAILLDEEARSGEAMFAPHAGRAKEPLMKYTALSRILPLDSPLGRYWNHGVSWREATGQMILNSPTVFNFYLPDFQPIGGIADADMVSPELKLHNTAKAISFVNMMYTWNMWDSALMYDWEGDDTPNNTSPYNMNNPDVYIIHEAFSQYIDQPEILVNELDKMLTYGQLSDETRRLIVDSLHDTYWTWNDDWRIQRIEHAIYFILMSPDFNIMK